MMRGTAFVVILLFNAIACACVAAAATPMKGTYEVHDGYLTSSEGPGCKYLPGGMNALGQNPFYAGVFFLSGTFYYPGPGKNGAQSAFDAYVSSSVYDYTDSSLYGTPPLLLNIDWPTTPLSGIDTWSGTTTLVAQQGSSKQSFPITFSETIATYTSRSFVMQGSMSFSTTEGSCNTTDQSTFIRTGD